MRGVRSQMGWLEVKQLFRAKVVKKTKGTNKKRKTGRASLQVPFYLNENMFNFRACKAKVATRPETTANVRRKFETSKFFYKSSPLKYRRM